MRVAIIDMGTNTFNLLIRDLEDSRVLLKNKISVRLGEGGLTKNKLTHASMERGMAALREHKQTIAPFLVDATYAFATSAVRDASNGPEFVERILNELGINVNTINGDKEAELIYLGVQQALEFDDKVSLIMDIGGGSTEFILANDSGIIWKKSYQLGVSRLLQKFNPSDPILNMEVERLNEFLDQELEELIEVSKKHSPITLIGSSGSFDTLAAMVLERFHPNSDLSNAVNYDFNMAEYHEIAGLMMTYNYDQRLRTPGMIPMRADLMVLACVLVNYVINKLTLKKLKLSTYSLKEGVFETLNKETILWQKS